MGEKCLIEVSVNSVRVSFRFAATHSEVDRALIKKYTRESSSTLVQDSSIFALFFPMFSCFFA